MTRIPDRSVIEETGLRIRDFIHETPILSSEIINEISGAKVYFKCENFQKAGAFKARGATNAVLSLSKDELKRGVCTHSSGNHAAALARAASIKRIPAHIVMPVNSKQVKIDAVKHYGGKITFCEPNLQSREDTLLQVKNQTGALEIHPYNDYRIIAGQATCAVEAFYNLDFNPDIIMAPVGGGGLLSGTALATNFFSPETRVIAGEPAGADDAHRSLKSGKFIPSIQPDTIADGLLTSLGSLTFPIIQEFVDDILIASDQVTIKVMRLLWERMKIVVEPSSAVPFAALLSNKEQFAGKSVVIILSGGNVDLENLPWNANTSKKIK